MESIVTVNVNDNDIAKTAHENPDRDAAGATEANGTTDWAKMSPVEIGEKLFQLRDFTPIPLILLMLLTAKPTVASATLGLIVIAFGELIRTYAVSFIGGVSRTRTTSTNQRLIIEGAFSIVRNPLYVGNFLITAGVAIYSGIVWIVILAAAAFAFQYYYIVKYEESLLIKKFGHEYEEYLKKVPAWIPAKIPDFDKMPWPETFAPAIRSEKRTLTAIALVVLMLMLKA
jgi:protein-S-isoprenylcysteine O-methyltransferase Ste14